MFFRFRDGNTSNVRSPPLSLFVYLVVYLSLSLSSIFSFFCPVTRFYTHVTHLWVSFPPKDLELRLLIRVSLLVYVGDGAHGLRNEGCKTRHRRVSRGRTGKEWDETLVVSPMTKELVRGWWRLTEGRRSECRSPPRVYGSTEVPVWRKSRS